MRVDRQSEHFIGIMADSNHLKNIAIVGVGLSPMLRHHQEFTDRQILQAGGNVGSAALKHLLASDREFNITIVTHEGSKSTFPSSPSIAVKKGSYDDAAFLQNAMKDQDAVVLALGFFGMGEQPKLIEAAAKAGVKYILPTEYAGDGLNKEMVDAVPVFHGKREARQQIEQLGAKWIGVATNPWADQSLRLGLCGVDLFNKKATLYSDSKVFNMSTLNQVGLGIARLLSLPTSNPENPRASLEHYTNNFVYISSFLVTQGRILLSAQEATGTSDSDWTMETDTVAEWIKRCKEQMAQGDRTGMMGITFAYYLGEGLGGNYTDKAVEDMRVLGLEMEDFDAKVKEEVEKGPMPKLF